MKEFLTALLQSLNQIEVKGKDNMDVLLGCIFAIEKKISEIDAGDKTEVTDDG